MARSAQNKAGKSSSATSKNSAKELALLKQENDLLKQEVAILKTKKESVVKKRSFWRSFFAGLSAVIAIVAFMLFNVSYWAQQTIVDNDKFVAAVSPVIKDPDVQNALKTEISNEIFSRIDVQAELEKVLPENLDFIAAPFAGQVKSFTTDKIGEVLQTPQVAEIWTSVLSTTHEKLIAYIQNPNNDGKISVDEIYTTVGDKLKDSQIGFLFGKNLPSSVGSITVKEITWLPKARQALNVLDKVTKELAIASVVFTLLAIGLSKRRGSMVIGLLSFSLLFMFATLLAVRIGATQVNSVLEAGQYAAAGSAVYRIISIGLVEQTQGFALLFASVLGVILITSGESWIVWLRTKMRQGLDWIFGKFASRLVAPKWLVWVAHNRVVIAWTLTGVAYAAFALRIPPTTSGVITALITSGIAVLSLEVIASFCRVAKHK